jgi:mycothiol system anti-sigma-R factor
VNCEQGAILHGYFDGELDAARSAEFERHLETCAECLAQLETQHAMRSSLQRAQLYELAPASLRAEVENQIHSQISNQRRRPAAPKSWPWLAVAAILLFAVVVLGLRYFPTPLGNQKENALAAQIVDAHLRSLQPGHLVDIVSTDQHTVKPWFDGKLEFAPPVRDFSAEGFPLQGGRLDAIGGKTIAALVYGRRKHEINLFLWPATNRKSAVRTGEHLGYYWIQWEKNGMEFWMVSDVAADDLLQLQNLLNQ